MGLTNKQQRFVDEYLVDCNATQAAIRCGYSKKSAYSIGQENLKKPEIASAIKAWLDEKAMAAEETKARLADIARGDIADLMDITPTNYFLRLMVKDDTGQLVVNPKTKLIKKIKQKTTTYLSKKGDGEDREVTETEIELYSAQEALNTFAKMHGLLVDRTEVSGPDGGAIPVEHFERALNKVYGGGAG